METTTTKTTTMEKMTTKKSIPNLLSTHPRAEKAPELHPGNKAAIGAASPPPSAHFQLFGGKKKVHPLQTQRHNLSNNFIKMERRNDGNFLIT
jgi:hypothetical protein